MSVKQRRRNCLCLVLVMALMLMMVLPAAAAVRPVETQSMLIGFNRFPGASEHRLLRSVGANVIIEYTFVPVLLIDVPVQAVAGLQRNPLVRYVEKDVPVYAVSETMDWGVKQVKAPAVWGQATGAGIKVAVLDSGIGPHEDLYVTGGVSFVGGKSYSDGNGHGTHVSGTIAALHNGLGLAGIAPGVDLYAVKVLNSGGSGSTSGVVSGIEWSLNNGMKIINMSLGSTEASQAMEDACNAAYSAGILLVAAAGNSGNVSGTGDSVSYPARYDSVVAVAATDANNKRASFSSTGLAVELAAPGVNINSTYKNSYASLSGTSMASPHVAGVAALVMAANPTLTNRQVRGIIKNTATMLSAPVEHVGYGLVDAKSAVSLAQIFDETLFTVSGSVKDEAGNGIPNANVVVEGTPYKTVTTDSGLYSIQLAEAEYTLTASSLGYETKSQSVLVHRDTTNVDFILTKSALQPMVNDFSISTKKTGRFTDIAITVRVNSEGTPVSQALVELALTRTEGGAWFFSGVTDSAGSVTFTLKKAASGNYLATLQSLSKDNFYWDQKGSTLSEPIIVN